MKTVWFFFFTYGTANIFLKPDNPIGIGIFHIPFLPNIKRLSFLRGSYLSFSVKLSLSERWEFWHQYFLFISSRRNQRTTNFFFRFLKRWFNGRFHFVSSHSMNMFEHTYNNLFAGTDIWLYQSIWRVLRKNVIIFDTLRTCWAFLMLLNK